MKLDTEFILYVKNQSRSCEFYKELFQEAPVLDVPGMTEFKLSENTKLGLMPETGIIKIIGHATADPAKANGIPRCELYLKGEEDSVKGMFKRMEARGALIISEFETRDWKDIVAYLADSDGHIIALAY